MRAPAFVLIALSFVATPLSGCTVLVSFDDRGDATLDGAPSKGFDATVVDAADAEAGGEGPDAAGDDLGDCSILSEGEPCAKEGDCRAVSTCHAGVCTTHPTHEGDACGKPPNDCHAAPVCKKGMCAEAHAVDDGTVCGSPAGVCGVAPLCHDGTCGASAPVADGTSCGSAPDACHAAPVCASGVCAPPAAVADQTVCGAAPTSCQLAPLCLAGVCQPPGNVTDLTECGSAPDVCHVAPVCSAGVCGAPGNAPDGTTCGAAPNACHEAPRCSGGTCAAAAEAANGTVCGDAPDTCHDAPTCSGGTCGKPAAFAEGAEARGGGAHTRCCSGKSTETTTVSNCGVCGWVCKSPQTCGTIDGEYACKGCTSDSQCQSGCCSIDPAPNHCSPSNCSGACQAHVCPDGSHCVTGTIDYCTY